MPETNALGGLHPITGVGWLACHGDQAGFINKYGAGTGHHHRGNEECGGISLRVAYSSWPSMILYGKWTGNIAVVTISVFTNQYLTQV